MSEDQISENTAEKNAKEQRLVTNVYGAFVASIIAQFIPLMIVQLFGFFLFCCVLLAAYIIRARSKEAVSLTANHMTYIIKTVWVASIFLTIGMMLGGAYIYYNADNSVMQQFLDRLYKGYVFSPYDFRALVESYMRENMTLILTASVLALGPGILYIGYRTVNGISRAVKGYRMSKPDAWF